MRNTGPYHLINMRRRFSALISPKDFPRLADCNRLPLSSTEDPALAKLFVQQETTVKNLTATQPTAITYRP